MLSDTKTTDLNRTEQQESVGLKYMKRFDSLNLESQSSPAYTFTALVATLPFRVLTQGFLRSIIFHAFNIHKSFKSTPDIVYKDE